MTRLFKMLSFFGLFFWVVGSVALYAVGNPSGYVQVVEEWTSAATPALSRVYNYGLDLISQRQPDVSTNYFIYDGHGSTRMLVDGSGNIANAFTYDAYGVLIASNAAPQTVYLYCGEQFDPDLGFYYLRARYLNPNTGRFWSMDSYDGSSQDPLSLHKYLYCQGNSINMVDPSGHDGELGDLLAGIFARSMMAANFVMRATSIVNMRVGMTIFRIQQNMWRVELALAGFSVGIAADEWLDSAALKSMNTGVSSTAVNVGTDFEQLVGANATGYQTFDHIIYEPDGKKSLVQLSSRADNPAWTDDFYIDKLKTKLMGKAEPLNTGRKFTPNPGYTLPVIEANEVASKSVLMAIPETRAHLVGSSRMMAMLAEVQEACPNVRSAVVALRGWRPGR